MGKGFEDLVVYQEARKFRRRVYALTRLLPEEEKYVLFPQMRRAANTVTNCIAEGHGSQTYRHNISYLHRSRASVMELQDDFNTCEDEGYFKKEHLDDIRAHAVRVLQLLGGYIRHLESKPDKRRRERRQVKRRDGQGDSEQELTN